MAPRTRAQATADADLGPGITRNEDGHLVNDRGYPMPTPGEYELEIVDAEEQVFPPNKYSTTETKAWRLRAALVGTKQGMGEYAEEPFTVSIFVNAPKKDNLLYKDPNTKAEKRTYAATVIESMGLDIPRGMKFSRVKPEGFIGGFLRAYVGHGANGYAQVKIVNRVDLPNGDIENRGVKPVINEVHLEANRALEDELFE